MHLKLQIEKLRREMYGQRSERSTRLLDQMELQLEELEATATEDELAAEKAAAKTTHVAAFSRKRGARKPFPEHLPRERVVVPGPTACACCGGARRWCTRQTKGETALNPSCYAITAWRRTESGRPVTNIRFNTATPTAASVCWALKPPARNRGPTSVL